ncbi:MAG: TnpV protein [Actinomycetota bacterium]|nr:TnpV protein [Actinomycetota bacterium]
MLTEEMSPPRPNRYGRMAQEHMARYLPTRYAQIPERTAYFAELGEQVAHAVEELVGTLMDSSTLSSMQEESYPDRRGSMNMARLRAEELVLAEMVFLAPESDPADAPRDEMGAFIGPDPAMGPWTPLYPPEEPED